MLCAREMEAQLRLDTDYAPDGLWKEMNSMHGRNSGENDNESICRSDVMRSDATKKV